MRESSLLAVLGLMASIWGPASAEAQSGGAEDPGSPAADAETDASPEEGESSADEASSPDTRSVGWVHEGHVQEGERLTESKTIHLVERFVENGRFYGTSLLVGVIRRASQRVAAVHGPVRLNVGELSPEGGGNARGHVSHESGRDADIGFYTKDGHGVPIELTRFVVVNQHGRGRDQGRHVRFDVARNWTFVEALITDEAGPVQMIFIAPALRSLLLSHAHRQDVDREIIERASRSLIPPHDVSPHDDHFHIRIYCPPDDRGVCRDRGPYWRWAPEGMVPEGRERLPVFWSYD